KQAFNQTRTSPDITAARLVGTILPTLPTGSPSPSPTGDANQAKPSNADTAPELPPGPPYRRAFIRRVLIEAAQRHQLDPKLVLALSHWESGWDQTRLSASRAVRPMQLLPATAAEAGPGLLGRPIDLDDP